MVGVCIRMVVEVKEVDRPFPSRTIKIRHELRRPGSLVRDNSILIALVFVRMLEVLI